MVDLRAHIREGDGVWWSQAGAEATPLVDALLDQVTDIGPVRAFSGLTFNRRLREVPPELTLVSYGAMGELRKARGLQIVPAHYSVLPRLFAERTLPGDVGLVQVSPPGPDGVCSLGIGVDYAADAVRHSRILIGEINHRMPATTGTPGIPLDRFAATVETDRPVPPAPDRAPDAVDEAIAARVAELVEDGDTVQMGVGALPTAIMDGLAGHRDLGFHSGMLTDGVLRLVEKGVLTGRRKEIDEGLLVTGTAIGSAELYSRLGELPVVFKPASYTHDPGVLARLRRLVAINSAIEVDLAGQVNGEAVGGRYLGGIGGQADF
uniref:acetyl-CoA hydrolase/transferase family protein n=1 Tax=Pseudonocardia pini TaxID=2758030 RepID=UPI0015F09AAA